jgi:hypothetical protein
MVAPENVTKIGGTGREEFWFDTTGFSVLPAFTRRANPWQYDNLTGPVYSNLDAVISKRFTLPGASRLEFRLEAYNALNQIIWTNPNVTIGASDFGRVDQPGERRPPIAGCIPPAVLRRVPSALASQLSASTRARGCGLKAAES